MVKRYQNYIDLGCILYIWGCLRQYGVYTTKFCQEYQPYLYTRILMNQQQKLDGWWLSLFEGCLNTSHLDSSLQSTTYFVFVLSIMQKASIFLVQQSPHERPPCRQMIGSTSATWVVSSVASCKLNLESLLKLKRRREFCWNFCQGCQKQDENQAWWWWWWWWWWWYSCIFIYDTYLYMHFHAQEPCI